MLNRMYQWVLTWADRPAAVPGLAVITLAEASVFPVPPDPLLMALCLGKPEKSYYYATVTSIFSVLGGILGYAIGHFLWGQVGDWFITNIPGVTPAGFDRVGGLYREYDFWAVFAAGFSPLPYKLFTLAAGVFEINFTVFLVASAISRSARFFLVAGLLKKFGPSMQRFIERNLGWLSLVFVLLLLAGFWVLKR
jgi:membrane protein YqaA with SNARE-associated domain